MENLTLDAANIMLLDTPISQTVETVKMQEPLVKGKAEESKRNQVDTILDDDLEEVITNYQNAYARHEILFMCFLNHC